MLIQKKMISILILLSFASCLSETSQKEKDNSKRQFFAALDPATVTAFHIVVNDPVLGGGWSARFVNTHQKNWELRSGSGELIWLDRKVNTNLLLHLLDAIRTLKFSEQISFQKDAGQLSKSLENFGLDSPHYIFQWESPKGAGVLHLGRKLSENSGVLDRYVRIIEGLSESIYLASGSLFALLTHIQKPKALRLQKFLTFEMDEVDFIEIRTVRNNKQTRNLRAEREGVDWRDLQKNKINPHAASLVQELDRLQIESFIDSAKEVRKRFDHFNVGVLFQVRFEMRKGNDIFLSVQKQSRSVYATLSTRSGALFELPDSFISFLKPLL